MSYVNPSLKPQFDSLPEELKTEILNRDVQIQNMQDFMKVLQDIIAEGE